MRMERYRLQSCCSKKWEQKVSQLGFMYQHTHFRNRTEMEVLVTQGSTQWQQYHGAKQTLKPPHPAIAMQVLAGSQMLKWLGAFDVCVRSLLIFMRTDAPDDRKCSISILDVWKTPTQPQQCRPSRMVFPHFPWALERVRRAEDSSLACLSCQNFFLEAFLTPLLADQEIQQVWRWWTSARA